MAGGSAGATLDMRGLSATAVAGLPVVVEISRRNRTGHALEVVDLADPDLAVLRWVWKAAADQHYEVALSDYFLSSVPEPAFPRLLRLGPGEVVSFRHAVPTPVAFPAGVEWTLAVTAVDPRDQSLASVETTFRGAAMEGVAGMPASERRLAQAALLARSRTDVLNEKLHRETLEQVASDLGGSHVLSRLLRLSRSLHDDRDLEESWRRLSRVSPDVEVLRNVLLYEEIARRRRDGAAPLPATIRRIAGSLPDGQPFVQEIRTLVAAGPRTR